MIDSTYTIKSSKLKSFHPVPNDKYQVQITDINLVTDFNQFKGEEEERLNFEFTILDKKNFDYESDGEKLIETTRGRRLWKRISPVNSAPTKNSKASWFYKLLCAVEGKEIPADQLKEINPASMIGQQVVVMVEEAKGYNNILNFTSIKEEMEAVPNADERVKEEQTKGQEDSDKETARVAKAFEEPSKENPKTEEDFIEGLEKEK